MASSPNTSSASQWEQFLLELVNQSRAEVGAKPLAFDAELVDAAGRHTDWMVQQDVFSHTGAGGSSADGRVKAAGYAWAAVGENVAYVGGSNAAVIDEADVQQLHANLMNSPGHRANILNGDYAEIGIGITQGDYKGRPAIFVTEDFAKPTAAEAAEPDSWFI